MAQSPSELHDSNRDLAQRITALGLAPFAQLILQACRPLALPAAQAIWMAQPTLSLLWRPHQVATWAQFLEDPEQIKGLIHHLESEN